MAFITIAPDFVIYIHDKILESEPGLLGLARDKSLDSALARVEHLIEYEGVDDIHELAAQYIISLAQGHVFNDGNKRTSLMTAYSFLKLNDFLLFADDEEAATTIEKVAKKELNRKQLTDWIKEYTVSYSKIRKILRKLEKE